MNGNFIDEEKLLACVHCGLCLSACPTYLETGNENHSPRGRIYIMRAIQNGQAPVNDTTVRHIDLCLGCRACEPACPSGVEYGNLLEHTRDHLERTHKRNWLQSFLRRIVIEQVFPFPMRLRIALRMGWLLKFRPFWWFLPAFAKNTLTLIPNNFPGVKVNNAPPRMNYTKGRVGHIEGCVMQVMFSDTNQSTVKLLNRSGWQVEIPKNQD